MGMGFNSGLWHHQQCAGFWLTFCASTAAACVTHVLSPWPVLCVSSGGVGSCYLCMTIVHCLPFECACRDACVHAMYMSQQQPSDGKGGAAGFFVYPRPCLCCCIDQQSSAQQPRKAPGCNPHVSTLEHASCLNTSCTNLLCSRKANNIRSNKRSTSAYTH